MRAESSPIQADDPGPNANVDLFCVYLPVPLIQKLSDAAARRGMTLAQGLAKALNDFVEEH